MAESKVHSSLRGRNVRPLVLEAKQVGDSAVVALNRLGIHIDPQFVHDQVKGLLDGGRVRGLGADSALVAPLTTPSVSTPLQFLQAWLPGWVRIITAARKIDTLVGIKTIGNWEDQEIVRGIMEPLATAVEYGDNTNIPLATYNANFERRTIVRGEMGLRVGTLEEARASAMKAQSAEEKRNACAASLEIFRNSIGFYGWYNQGANRTFGFLNDPNLPAIGTLPSGKSWAGATFQEMTTDIRTMVAALRTQSQDQIDPESVDIILALPTNKVDQLSTTTDFGISVRDWIKQTYPRITVQSAPELTAASSNADVVYMYAESIDSSIDGSTDGGETFIQMVPQKLRTLGVEKRAKSYLEDFANATAGVLCQRPYAVVRYTGL
ncbi:main capsid and scaffold protein [Aeromonas phage Gekk3-15]